jgi:branched-chain amino acid transport system substrate-binding protein
VIVGAVSAAMGDKEWSDSLREDVVKATQDFKGEGATGELGFDENGDSVNTTLTVYQVASGDWKSVKTGKFGE